MTRQGPPGTLASPAEATAILRVHSLTEEQASAEAGSLDLPLTLTMRGCIVYATKAA